MSLPDILAQVVYNEAAKRWMWTAGSGSTGFVAERTIAAELERHQQAMKATLQDLTRQVIAGEISVPEWQTAFALEVKTGALAQAIFAAGGPQNMGFPEFGRVGNFLRTQYERLNTFAQKIAAGNASEGQAVVQAGMYADTSEAAYWNQWAADRPGGDNLSHLPKLPTKPREWQTACGNNCRCFLRENPDGSIDWIDTGDEKECDDCPGLASGGPYRP